jgi:hypothetical protein
MDSATQTAVNGALTTGMQGFMTQIGTQLVAVLPIALGVAAAIAGISYGVHFFRKTARV